MALSHHESRTPVAHYLIGITQFATRNVSTRPHPTHPPQNIKNKPHMFHYLPIVLLSEGKDVIQNAMSRFAQRWQETDKEGYKRSQPVDFTPGTSLVTPLIIIACRHTPIVVISMPSSCAVFGLDERRYATMITAAVS